MPFTEARRGGTTISRRGTGVKILGCAAAAAVRTAFSRAHSSPAFFRIRSISVSEKMAPACSPMAWNRSSSSPMRLSSSGRPT